MTTSLLSLPLSAPLPGPIKRKRVLLVDASLAKRELRAEAMRKLGMDVDCACNIAEARSWWRADLYDLVLINLENDLSHRDDFCADIRVATPPQKMAFLVGKPEYLSDSPDMPVLLQREPHGDIELRAEAETADAIGSSEGPDLQWGIMAASRRISAVRSLFAARSVAVRNRPTPLRDLERRPSTRDETVFQLAAELRREELQ